MTAGYPRVNCSIPGCGRGTTRLRPGWDPDTNGPVEWICGRHWRLVPKEWKRRRRLLWKHLNRNWPDCTDWNDLDVEQRHRAQRCLTLLPKLWTRMKARAEHPLGDMSVDLELEEIERRFGIV